MVATSDNANVSSPTTLAASSRARIVWRIATGEQMGRRAGSDVTSVQIKLLGCERRHRSHRDLLRRGQVILDLRKRSSVVRVTDRRFSTSRGLFADRGSVNGSTVGTDIPRRRRHGRVQRPRSAAGRLTLGALPTKRSTASARAVSQSQDLASSGCPFGMGPSRNETDTGAGSSHRYGDRDRGYGSCRRERRTCGGRAELVDRFESEPGRADARRSRRLGLHQQHQLPGGGKYVWTAG